MAPNQPRIADLPGNSDEMTDPDNLSITRPFIGYPAVVYTGKYADAVTLLKAASRNMTTRPAPEQEAFGIHDPDVDRIEITVEVETLKMDNLQSDSGKDNYVLLYRTERSFPVVATEDDYAKALKIPLVYRDVKVLHTSEKERNLPADFGFPGDIKDLDEIFLPTARAVRLTLRAVCEEKAENKDYYGLIGKGRDPENDSRYGHPIEVRLYRPSRDETDLFVDTAPAQRLQGIYLQPTSLSSRMESLLLSFSARKCRGPRTSCSGWRSKPSLRALASPWCRERRACAIWLLESNPAHARAR